jgi:hypothetical protein
MLHVLELAEELILLRALLVGLVRLEAIGKAFHT